MKHNRFDLTTLENLEVGDKFRILTGPLADYNRVVTLTDIYEDKRFVDIDGTEKCFWGFEAEVIEVEVA